MKILIFFIISLCVSFSANAELIRLKSGKVLEGDIIGRTKTSIKISTSDTVYEVPLSYIDDGRNESSQETVGELYRDEEDERNRARSNRIRLSVQERLRRARELEELERNPPVTMDTENTESYEEVTTQDTESEVIKEAVEQKEKKKDELIWDFGDEDFNKILRNVVDNMNKEGIQPE